MATVATTVWQIGIVLGAILAVNLMPAFAPPTWSLLVYFRVTFALPGLVLVALGALAATTGRGLLALAFRRLATRLPARRRESLEALGSALAESRLGLVAAFGFFVVSPLPSNALFEAAGLARVRLAPLLTAFLIGRLGSYAVYVSVTGKVQGTVRDILEGGLTSSRAVLIGVVGILALFAMVLVDWMRIIDRIRRRRSGTGRRREPVDGCEDAAGHGDLVS